MGGVGGRRLFGTTIPYFLPSIPFVFISLRTLCTHQNLNPFVFNRFRTLCQKPPGVGTPVDSSLPLISLEGGGYLKDWGPTSVEGALYPAISRFYAKGHSPSIHCPSQRNPVRAAISRISPAWYLCELSVQMVSSSSSMSRRLAA